MSGFGDLAISYALGGSLVVSRLAGFVVVSPFPGGNVPPLPKMALVVTLAYFVMSSMDPGALPTAIDGALLGASVVEVGLGLALGFVFRVAFSAAEVLAQVSGQSIGLGMASTYDPHTESQESALGRVLILLAMLVAFAVGAHRVALSAVLGSFAALPVGTSVHLGNGAPVLLSLAGRALAEGVHLALPVIVITLGVQVALAFVARAAPSLQIFNIGMAILVAAGLCTLLASAETMVVSMAEWTRGLAGFYEAFFAAVKG